MLSHLPLPAAGDSRDAGGFCLIASVKIHPTLARTCTLDVHHNLHQVGGLALVPEEGLGHPSGEADQARRQVRPFSSV